MTAAVKIAKWVQKKPLILIRFDEAFSESLHKAETEALATIIQEAAKGNKAVVLAWQQKIQEAAQ